MFHLPLRINPPTGKSYADQSGVIDPVQTFIDCTLYARGLSSSNRFNYVARVLYRNSEVDSAAIAIKYLALCMRQGSNKDADAPAELPILSELLRTRLHTDTAPGASATLPYFSCQKSGCRRSAGSPVQTL